MERIRHISHYLKKTEDVLAARGNRPELPINSIPSFNRKIWGLPKGKLIIVGARTSMGKTSFVLQIATDLMKLNKSVFYLSFEMMQDEILERMFCSQYRINNFDLLKGGFKQYLAEWEDFKKYIDGKTKFIVSDGFGKSWKELDSFLNNLTVQPDVVILDYIQAIAGSSVEGKGFIDEYIRRFRELCIKRGFAGIIVSQLNRQTVDSADKTPQLHNLKGSGFLEEHADMVILLDWVGKHKEDGDFVINIAKNRSGKTGHMNIKYIPEYYLFEDNSDEKTTYANKAEELSSVGWEKEAA